MASPDLESHHPLWGLTRCVGSWFPETRIFGLTPEISASYGEPDSIETLKFQLRLKRDPEISALQTWAVIIYVLKFQPCQLKFQLRLIRVDSLMC